MSNRPAPTKAKPLPLVVKTNLKAGLFDSQNSDARLKTAIQPVTGALALLAKIELTEDV
jgi:hypothetical protein